MTLSPKINYILIFGSLLVFSSTFSVFNHFQGCFSGPDPYTLMQAAGGIPLIMLSSGVVFFAYHKKKKPTVIFFVLSLILSCGYVFGLIIDIIDTWGSTTYNRPGLGFYLLLFGQVTMITSFPLHSHLTNRSKSHSEEQSSDAHIL